MPGRARQKTVSAELLSPETVLFSDQGTAFYLLRWVISSCVPLPVPCGFLRCVCGGGHVWMHPLPLSASPETLRPSRLVELSIKAFPMCPCSAVELPNHRVILVLAFVRSFVPTSIIAVLPALAAVQGSRLLHLLSVSLHRSHSNEREVMAHSGFKWQLARLSILLYTFQAFLHYLWRNVLFSFCDIF